MLADTIGEPSTEKLFWGVIVRLIVIAIVIAIVITITITITTMTHVHNQHQGHHRHLRYAIYDPTFIRPGLLYEKSRI